MENVEMKELFSATCQLVVVLRIVQMFIAVKFYYYFLEVENLLLGSTSCT